MRGGREGGRGRKEGGEWEGGKGREREEGGERRAPSILTYKGERIFSVQEAIAMMVAQTGMIGWIALATLGPAQKTPTV